MTRISFYILKEKTERARQVFACHLAEKAYKLGNHVYIYTKDEQQSEKMDYALWSFCAESFVPHQIDTEDNAENCPVLIGNTSNTQRFMDLLINLHNARPAFIDQFKRMAELINEDHIIKATGRTRYKFYKKHDYTLDTFYMK